MTDALALLQALRLEDGRRWGEAATQVQVEDARAVLDAGSQVRRHWLGRARGYSKTTDVGGLSLAAMLTQLPPGSTSYAAAADRDQARLLIDSMRGFVARTPELHGLVDVGATRVRAVERACDLEVLAADAASAYGLRMPWLVVDELCQWPATAGARAFYDAVTSALPKNAAARSVTITTAGDPAHWAAKVHAAALAEPELWRVSEVAGPPPWMQRRLIDAERRRLLPSTFARLFLNEWCAPEDRLADPDDLAACMTLAGPLPPSPGETYVVTLDVGITNDRTVAVVAHLEQPAGSDSPMVVVDRLHRWAGSRVAPVDLADVSATVEAMARSYNGARVVFDPYQAALLAQQLRARGVWAEEFTFTASSVGRLASTLHGLIRSRSLRLPDDDDLRAELLAVRLRTNATGTVRLDHDSGRHDDQAVAVALAGESLLGGFATSTADLWTFAPELDAAQPPWATPQLPLPEGDEPHPLSVRPAWWPFGGDAA